VRNAVQVSAAGEKVRVEVRRKPDRAELSVHDAGPGIPSEARERLFDAFFTTRSHGTGVGLAVVKRVVDQHGFSIEVESSQDGTTFRVVVPKRSLAREP
jgi:signal transduction histidine kinase